ncbi:nuclear transport factor 2 family protein [Rhodococcus koreensis]
MHAIRGDIDTPTRSAIHDLVVEFTWKLDHAEPAGFAELFEADGRFVTGQAVTAGTAALQAFADGRTAMARTSRSVLSNHRLVRLSTSSIEGTVLVTLYMHDGLEAGEPIAQSVAEYRDIYVRGADHVWRFRERRSVPIFTRSA